MTDKLLIVLIVILFLGTLVWLEMRKTQQTPSQPTPTTRSRPAETTTPKRQPRITPSPTPTPTSQPTSTSTSVGEPSPSPSPSPKATNLVPLAEYSTDSTYGPGYEVKKAFDSSTSTRWSAAKGDYSAYVSLTWQPARVVTSIRWLGLASKYGAPKDFSVYCVREGVASGIFSVNVKNYQGSSWSNMAVKDKDGNPAKVNECRIEINDVQDRTFAATLTEIQVEGY